MTEKRLFITWIGNIVGLLVTPLFVIWGKPSWRRIRGIPIFIIRRRRTQWRSARRSLHIIKFRALVLQIQWRKEITLFDINQALSLWGMTTFLPCLLGVGHYMVTACLHCFGCRSHVTERCADGDV